MLGVGRKSNLVPKENGGRVERSNKKTNLEASKEEEREDQLEIVAQPHWEFKSRRGRTGEDNSAVSVGTCPSKNCLSTLFLLCFYYFQLAYRIMGFSMTLSYKISLWLAHFLPLPFPDALPCLLLVPFLPQKLPFCFHVICLYTCVASSIPASDRKLSFCFLSCLHILSLYTPSFPPSLPSHFMPCTGRKEYKDVAQERKLGVCFSESLLFS